MAKFKGDSKSWKQWIICEDKHVRKLQFKERLGTLSAIWVTGIAGCCLYGHILRQQFIFALLPALILTPIASTGHKSGAGG